MDYVANPDEFVLKEFGKDVFIDVVQKNWKEKLGLESSSSNFSSELSVEDEMLALATEFFMENNLRCMRGVI